MNVQVVEAQLQLQRGETETCDQGVGTRRWVTAPQRETPPARTAARPAVPVPPRGSDPDRPFFRKSIICLPSGTARVRLTSHAPSRDGHGGVSVFLLRVSALQKRRCRLNTLLSSTSKPCLGATSGRRRRPPSFPTPASLVALGPLAGIVIPPTGFPEGHIFNVFREVQYSGILSHA